MALRLLAAAALMLLACDGRRVDLGQEVGPDDDGPLVLTPAVCGRPPRTCAATIRWWFTFGDERDDRVRGLALDDAGRVYLAGALATTDRSNAWRTESVAAGLTAAGRLRWWALIAHRNRNWADVATGVLWQAPGSVLLAGQHGINGHQAVPWLDELTDDGEGVRRKLTVFDHPECAVYPCIYQGGAELGGMARAGDGLVWLSGKLEGEPDAPLPWLERPTPGREDGHGVLVAVAPGGERVGRTFGDLRIEQLTDVAPLPGGDAAAVGLGRVNGRLTPAAVDVATLLRFGRDRSIRWTRELRSPRAVVGVRMTADASGRLFVTASFAGALDVAGRPVIAGSAIDGMLAAFDPEGGVLWVATWPQGEGAAGTVTAVDGRGQVLVASATGAGVRPRAAGVVPAAGPGGWVGRFTPEGAFVAAAAIDTGGTFQPLALAAARDGTVLVGGAFWDRLATPARELARSAGGADGVAMAVMLPAD